MQAPYKLLDHIKNQLDTGSLFVEIGSARDGGSTGYLNDLAKSTANGFVTIDVDPIYLGPTIETVTMSGEEWVSRQLPNRGSRIGLVYMDGGDWISAPAQIRAGQVNPDITNLISEYERKGIKLNNITTMVAQTKQIAGMLPYMINKCAVMLCDTSFSHVTDSFVGKGAGAAYILMAEGFKLIGSSYKQPYLILARGIQGNESMSNLDMDVLDKVYTGPKSRPDVILYKNVE